MVRLIAGLWILAMGTLITSCATGTPPPVAPVVEYTLGTGDRMAISVFGQDDLSAEVAVDSSGAVQMPLIGSVAASGLTTVELRESVEEELRNGYLANPRVSIEVLNYRPFYILGEVTRPGNYDYVDGLTVMMAAAMAEGFTYRASERKVLIKRAGEEDYTVYQLSGTTPILPGDTVLIPDRRF